MKKRICSIFLIMIIFLMAGCQNSESHIIEIIVPPGSMELFVYSEEEISPQKDRIKIHAWAGLSDTEVVLKPVEIREERSYEPTYLTQGMPVDLQAEKDGWFKIGVSVQNEGDRPIIVSVKAENVEVRIP